MLYVAISPYTILDQVMHGVTTKKEKKLMQFVTLFHLLSQGIPSINYEKL
jgi:hypothetical protein